MLSMFISYNEVLTKLVMKRRVDRGNPEKPYTSTKNEGR